MSVTAAPFQLAVATSEAVGTGATRKTSRLIEADSESTEKLDVDVVQDQDQGEISTFINKGGERVLITWTKAEQNRVVRKADFLFLPIFTILFFWMAVDRTNISGVLTSTFLKDTGITRDQANTGTSLLWFGIVLLEIPSNVILHRVGPHWWIPSQVVAWGIAECLQACVTNAGGWYAARLFLGLLESGFIPGSLYTLSRWYTRDELAKRTVIFFYGPSISAAFGSLISAGCLKIEGALGLAGWQWIFVVCGVSTIASGLIAFLVIPASPRQTAKFYNKQGWLSEREADIFMARLYKDDPLKETGSTMNIKVSDIVAVLTNPRIWPHLLMCLSGLQAVGGLSTWGAVIIKSLGFSSIRANLLNVPAPMITCIISFFLAAAVDRYKRYGYAIIFTAVWTVAGLIALYHLPITARASWAFYATYVVTLSAPSWQPLNVTWLSLNSKTPQQRAIAYAVYIGCSNLGGTYGNQVFRGSDAPLYRKAWAACLSLGAVWLAVTIFQTIQYALSNRAISKREKDAEKIDAASQSVQRYYI